MELSERDFENQKKQILEGVDSSKKGSIDSRIEVIVDMINSSPDYVTTSSCSGRIILFTQENFGKGTSKQNCKWLYTSHELINPGMLIDFVDPSEGDLVVKFEPFILHILCKNLSSARLMQKLALESGFRNSGMVIGNHGRITVAVRSTHSLEVPLSDSGTLLVSNQYLLFLGVQLNFKMEENMERVDRFRRVIEKCIID